MRVESADGGQGGVGGKSPRGHHCPQCGYHCTQAVYFDYVPMGCCGHKIDLSVGQYSDGHFVESDEKLRVSDGQVAWDLYVFENLYSGRKLVSI